MVKVADHVTEAAIWAYNQAESMKVLTAVFVVALACVGSAAACNQSHPAVESEKAVAVAVSVVQVLPNLHTAELMVEGTSCASCAVGIRRELHQLKGIGEIKEGTTKQHIVVEFDPTLVSPEQLVRAVSDAGYEAEILVHGASAPSGRHQGT